MHHKDGPIGASYIDTVGRKNLFTLIFTFLLIHLNFRGDGIGDLWYCT